MTARRQVARDVTYAGSAATRGGRAMIRLLENGTGRAGLIRRAEGYQAEIDAGRSFWEVIPDRFGLSLDVTGGTLDAIPRTGPLIVIANHPYGILDGLMLGHILWRSRGDFRILANSVFRGAADLDRVVLPVAFGTDKAARLGNLETRRSALELLGQGGAIGVFPGGTVSTAARPFAQPMDPGWRGFTARMIARSDAVVVPVFFEGHTSRLFQVASHLHPTLRLGLLIREFRRRTDRPVRVVIGAPLERAALSARAGDAKAMMDYLRKATYELSPTPLEPQQLGFEFDKTFRV